MAMMNATAEQMRATPGMAAWVGLMMDDYWTVWVPRRSEELQRLPEALAMKYLCMESSRMSTSQR